MACSDVAALGTLMWASAGLLRLSPAGLPPSWWLFTLVAWVAAAAYARLLPGWGLSPASELERLAKVALTVMLALSAWVLLGGQPNAAQLVEVLPGLPLAVPAMVTLRAATRRLLDRAGLWGVSAVIYADPERARQMVSSLLAAPGLGYRPVAIVDRRSPAAPEGDVLGVPLRSTIPPRGTGMVAMFTTKLESGRLSPWVSGPQAPYAAAVVLPEGFEGSCMRLAPSDSTGIIRLAAQRRQAGAVARAVKRLTDLTLALLAAPLWVPLCLLIALLIWADDRQSPLYRQQRVGRRGNLFLTWKFRTMVPNAEAVLQRRLAEDPALREEWRTQFKLRRDPRITRMGALLRKTSLDELPQLINVLRGEMSLIGPRPLPSYHHEQLSSASQAMRLHMLPGMTGLWQVSGRSEAGNAGLERWDPNYVSHWSVWLDAVILMRTVRVVLLGSGAY